MIKCHRAYVRALHICELFASCHSVMHAGLMGRYLPCIAKSVLWIGSTKNWCASHSPLFKPLVRKEIFITTSPAGCSIACSIHQFGLNPLLRVGTNDSFDYRNQSWIQRTCSLT